MFCAWHQKIKITFCNIFFLNFHLRPGDPLNILQELQESVIPNVKHKFKNNISNNNKDMHIS